MWIISYLIIVYVFIFIYNSETFIILLGNNCQYTYNSVRPWYPLRFGIDLYTSNVLRACKTGSIHNAIYKTPHGWNARFLGQTRRRESPFLRASKGFWTIGGKYLKLLPPHQSSFPQHFQVRSTDPAERAPATSLLYVNPEPHRYTARAYPQIPP